MKTGTDVSIAECRFSGYPVVDHVNPTMNPKQAYLLTISTVGSWSEGGRVLNNRKQAKTYDYYGRISYEELWAKFLAQGQGIKDYCDFKNRPFPDPDEKPTYQDFVNLAQTLDCYCGIE